MKVGMVCPYDWSYPGGVRTHIIGLTGELGRRGIEVEVIAPSSNPEPEVFAVGSTVGVPSNGSIARVCFSRSAASRIEERMDRGDIDLLHLHEPGAPSVSLLALLKAKRLPLVATFHAAAEGSLGYRVFRPVLAPKLRRIDQCIAVSNAARGLISRYFPGDYRLIPNGIDGRRFGRAGTDTALEDLKPFVLFVGRLEKRKGFDVAVRAVEKLRRDLDVRLVTTASAPDNSPDWVISVAPVDDDRLPSVFAAADVYCAPSVGGESFGLVLLEAMASGVPVVASELPGYREAAGDAAIFHPVGDSSACARELLRVLSDAQLSSELSRRGRDRAALFDWQALAPQVLDVYGQASEKSYDRYSSLKKGEP